MSVYNYHLDEGSLRLPTGFRDATVNVFEWADANGRVALTIQREKLGEQRTFAEVVLKVTAPYPKVFTSYEEEEPMEIAMSVPVVSKRFRWRQTQGVLYHHQVFLDLGHTVMMMTAAGKASARARVDEMLHEALHGMQLREQG